MTWRLAILLVGLGVTGLTSWLWHRIEQPPTTEQIARQLFDAGRPRDALLLFEDPMWRGIAEYRAGRYDRAIGEFRPADNVLALYNLGTTYAQLAEWNGAIAALETVLRLDPDNADAQHNLEIVRRAAKLEVDQQAPTPDDARLQDAGGDQQNKPGGDKGDPEPQTANAPPENDTQSAESLIDRKGNSDKPGDLRQTKVSQHAGTADAPGNPEQPTEETARETRESAELMARESQQAAEILLREITDDPKTVLRVRLYVAHQNRLLGSQ